MTNTVVDRLYGEYKEIIKFLDAHEEPSFRSSIEDIYRKSILLASASYFEMEICDCILCYTNDVSKNRQLVSFIKNKAISRQYHTFFDWGEGNANRFFNFFGEEFAQSMKDEVARDLSLKESIIAFLEIGKDRNRLVHGNFAAFSLEKTTEEIYCMYQKGLRFIQQLPKNLRNFSSSNNE